LGLGDSQVGKFLLYPWVGTSVFRNLESPAMRFEQRKSASIRVGVAVVFAGSLFASGSLVFASGQGTPPPVPATQQPAPPAPEQSGPTVRVSQDEAVRMAMQNNLGLSAEQLGPQIQTYAVAGARSAFAPTLLSTASKSSSTNPPGNFLTGTGSTLTNEGFRTSAGVQQLVPWGGGRYSLGWDGSRGTTSDASSRFNPTLNSNLDFSFTQPLLRNFTIDSARQGVLLSEKRQEIADVQLTAAMTQTARQVRIAYFNLVNAIARLEVDRQSLDLARQSLKNNQRKVEVGTMAPIDIVEAEAEVARNEESVIVSEGNIKAFEDALRTLIMNPSQPEFWTTRLEPTDQPTLTAQPIDVDAAITNALANRTDLVQFRKQVEETDIGLRFLRNQKLPGVDFTVNYGLTGTAGTQREFDFQSGVIPPPVLRESERSFADALRDVLGNDFRTWSVAVNFNYPIGTSAADAALAQNRLQRQQQATALREFEMQVVASVRDAARNVTTALQRVTSTRKARELAEQRLQAEDKRLAVGLSDTFRSFQAQRDLANARVAELSATIAYNRALIDFEAVQTVPVR
jgi:outer membrane protein TolC